MMRDGIDLVVSAILAKHQPGERLIVAVAGPPASGKSTFSEALVAALNAHEDNLACGVPMDGYHLDNRQLDRLGLRARKGAPQTFDFDGFRSQLGRLREPRRPVYFPVFDRGSDLAIAGAGVVLPGTDVIVVEGNYLMLDEEPWSGLATCFDVEIFLRASMACLEERLIRRWLAHGHDPAAAARRAKSNDIPNAELILGKVRDAPGALFLRDDED